MKAQKRLSTEEIERRLIEDAENPDAWEPAIKVSASRSPRPAWYRGLKEVNRRERDLLIVRQLPSGGTTRRASRRGSASDKTLQLSTFYQQYYGRLVHFYSTSFRLARPDAEELAQDAFVRFYEAMNEYRGEAEWAYLETIARNVAYNSIRSQKSQNRTAQIIDIEEARRNRQLPVRQEIDLSAREEQALLRKCLHDAIAELPEGQRRCIQLWLDGFTYDDISKALAISADVVKSRLHHAKIRLRSRMEEASGDCAAIARAETR
jgi:RNA polymerase sigma factor (sigma-70 family)